MEGEAQDKQPSGMQKLKVAVYGEEALADSGKGLKRSEGSIQGLAFFPPCTAYIIFPHTADGGTGYGIPEQIILIP